MIVLSSSGFGDPEAAARAAAQERYDSIYEEAVLMIKKYETMHKPRHWPLIGYGHLVMAGEKYRRGDSASLKPVGALKEKENIHGERAEKYPDDRISEIFEELS